jgi:hypothetical protein
VLASRRWGRFSFGSECAYVSWDLEFHRPITVPGKRKQLVTLAAGRQCSAFCSSRGKLVMYLTASRRFTSGLRLPGTGIGLKNSRSQDTTPSPLLHVPCHFVCELKHGLLISFDHLAGYLVYRDNFRLRARERAAHNGVVDSGLTIKNMSDVRKENKIQKPRWRRVTEFRRDQKVTARRKRT